MSTHGCRRSQSPEEGSDPLELELAIVVSCPVQVLETELGSLQEQYALLKDKPSLHPTQIFEEF